LLEVRNIYRVTMMDFFQACEYNKKGFVYHDHSRISLCGFAVNAEGN